jgi:hypothetical protein
VAGIVGLFPNYLGGSIAGQPDQLVPHAIYLAAWTASALLIASGAARQRIGALLGLGTSVVTFGLLAADLATALSKHAPAGGMWPTLLGWLLATAGAAAGYNRAAAGAPAKPRAQETGPLLMLLLWPRRRPRSSRPGTSSRSPPRTGPARRHRGQRVRQPGLVIVSDVLVSPWWWSGRAVAPGPAGRGLCGATILMAAQAISALVQLSGASPASRSPCPRRAAAAHLTAGSPRCSGSTASSSAR